MLLKVLIVTIMLMILISLASSLIFLIHDKGQTKRSVKALSLRIGLSLSLFIFLLLAFNFGWINPHNLPIK